MKTKTETMKIWHLKMMLLLVFSTSLLWNCTTTSFVLPTELIGDWKAEKTKITVRTSPRWMKFIFTSDYATAQLTIHDDKTASGFIGTAKFKNGKILKNGGNPDKTGISHIIQCGSIGKIFPNDPVNSKEVELWIKPLKQQGVLDAELRYTENGAMFPMADIRFYK